MNKRLYICATFCFCALVSVVATAASYSSIIIPEPCHPAIKSAAQLIAKELLLPESAVRSARQSGIPSEGQIVLTTGALGADQARLMGSITRLVTDDGYAIQFVNSGAIIYGARPRSFLYAAGDAHLWKDRTSDTWVRSPSFSIRTAAFYGRKSVSEYVATLGVNGIIGGRKGTVTLRDSVPQVYNELSRTTQSRFERAIQSSAAENAQFTQACRDADVEYYPFLYGNDMARWSPELYAAAVKAYPSIVGKPPVSSWEKATLCPSEPMTWEIIRAYVKEFAQQRGGDGLYVTFWDNYGIDCQCERCVKSGLNKFPNQLYECVRQYREALAPLGKKLIVRTWSSGVPHWLGDEWVHAPGYDPFSGTGADLWGRVIRDVPSDVILQTKVYDADCQPDAPFSPLLGKARPHNEIAEWQMTGQTTGRYYFPASTVDHTALTMKKSYTLLGNRGGVCLFPGGTAQSNYDLLDDIANSINVYAWRQLSWQVNANVDEIWMNWARPLFGERAARHVVNALKLSEKAVNNLFSTLGLGSDTNAGFPNNIKRRETLLKYTNRYYTREGQQNLLPTRENIDRVIAEKNECMKLIDEMSNELAQARPYLRKDQADELATRFDWLREFGNVSRNLDESLWRYRYLRYQASMLTTDPGQMKYLAASFDAVAQHRKLLFRFDPAQKFSCYNVPLGQLEKAPSLGSPIPLMRELYDASEKFVEETVGPDYLPAAWKR